MLVHEVLSRKLRDQRAVARYQTRTTGAKPSVRKTMIVALARLQEDSGRRHHAVRRAAGCSQSELGISISYALVGR
jgi:hypothetical protein